ncbi:MAG: hypothetical protein WBB45_03825 [Cyclobacteriaceae bacterium]
MDRLKNLGLLTRITTEEGRVAPDEQDADTWRYYYNLTDRLGNVRVTVTDPTATEYLATLEDTNSEEEEAEFTVIRVMSAITER